MASLAPLLLRQQALHLAKEQAPSKLRIKPVESIHHCRVIADQPSKSIALHTLDDDLRCPLDRQWRDGGLFIGARQTAHA